MLNTLSRLQICDISTYENSFVSVRAWFFHNTWTPALPGNVAQMSLSDKEAILRREISTVLGGAAVLAAAKTWRSK